MGSVRPPKRGREHYTGFSRSKLYELDAKGKIICTSIGEPAEIRGARLFNLKNIVDLIGKCESSQGCSDSMALLG
jgi:hypothetical protein